MKFRSAIVTMLMAASIQSGASTPPEAVDKLDKAREGDLARLVLSEFEKTQKVDCEPVSIPKYQIIKVSSASTNESKQPGTPYDYEATYLVIQKCLYGSTFAGAYSDPQKSSIMRASFTSEYDKSSGPNKMENLIIQHVKDIDLTILEN